jgi:hypothetical protein
MALRARISTAAHGSFMRRLPGFIGLVPPPALDKMALHAILDLSLNVLQNMWSVKGSIRSEKTYHKQTGRIMKMILKNMV